MSKKMLKACKAILLVLLATIMLTGCGSNMTSLSKFSELIEYELDEISLTIYFWTFSVRANTTLESLKRIVGENRIVITGEELAEHRDLLNQLANVELVPLRNNLRVDARMYYVFEHTEHGEIFSFLTYAIGAGGGNFDAVFANGQEVRGNRIFFEVVFPFLNEDAVSEIQRNIDRWLPVSE